ncbi:MAG: hypothetical protein K0U45_04775 [Alphaproteobacteria bacterium]|nr:hypothetical protein [Alphaproteobacteria bacterium]
MSLFLQTLNENAHVALFAIIIIVICALMWLSHFIGKWKERGGLFEDWRKAIPAIQINLDNIVKKLAILDDIQLDVRELQRDSPSPVVQTKSPISLNQKGERISNAIDAKEIITSIHENFYKTLSEKQQQNPFDIQEAAFEYANAINASLNQDVIDKFKKVAYDEGISMLDIHRILGVLLRDSILKECGFAPDEIDEHNPTAK